MGKTADREQCVYEACFPIGLKNGLKIRHVSPFLFVLFGTRQELVRIQLLLIPGANASCKNIGVNNFPDEVKWVKIADLHNCEGNPVSFRWFNAGTTKHSEAFVISSVGILVLALRQHTNNNVWKESEVLQSIRATVNLLTLAQIQSLLTLLAIKTSHEWRCIRRHCKINSTNKVK